PSTSRWASTFTSSLKGSCSPERMRSRDTDSLKFIALSSTPSAGIPSQFLLRVVIKTCPELHVRGRYPFEIEISSKLSNMNNHLRFESDHRSTARAISTGV